MLKSLAEGERVWMLRLVSSGPWHMFDYAPMITRYRFCIIGRERIPSLVRSPLIPARVPYSWRHEM